MSLAGLTLDTKTLDETLGALFIGFGVSTGLLGVLTTQVWSYYRQFPNDALYLRIIVPLVWCLELIDDIFIAHGSYHYTVRQWGNPLGIIAEKPLWSIVLGQTFGTIVGTLVKCVFTARVWRFSNKNIYVTAIIMAIIILQFCCGMYFTKEALEQPTFITSIANLKKVATLALASGFVSDLLTAATLAYYLFKMKTGYDGSDNLINSLIRYGLSTGLLSGGMSLTTLILYNVKPRSLDVCASFFVLSKILAISLMSSLNTRKTSHHRTPSSLRTSQPAPLPYSSSQPFSTTNSNTTSHIKIDMAPSPKADEGKMTMVVQGHRGEKDRDLSEMVVLRPNRVVAV